MSDSRKYLMLGLVMLCTLSLACTLGQLAKPFDEPPSKVDIVDVTPDSGTGTFTIAITYYWATQDPKYQILCAYPETFAGSDSSTPLPVKRGNNTYTITALATKPGTYTLACQDSFSYSAQDVFTVEEADPTAEGAQPPIRRLLNVLNTRLPTAQSRSPSSLSHLIDRDWEIVVMLARQMRTHPRDTPSA